MAALGLAAAVFAIRLVEREDRSRPAVPPAPAIPDVASTIDLNAGEVTPLPETLRGGESYDASPGGTMLAYTRFGGLYVADVDGADVHEVPTGGLEPLSPSWSPDGSLLVFQGLGRDARGRDARVRDLFVVDVTTDEVSRVTDLKPRAAWWYDVPSFSPDGETILFHLPRRSEAGARWDLWSVPAVGGEPTLVRPDAAMGVYVPQRCNAGHPPRTEGGRRRRLDFEPLACRLRRQRSEASPRWRDHDTLIVGPAD